MVVALNCSSLQAVRRAAAEALAVTPAGSSTSTFTGSVSAIPLGLVSPSLGRDSPNSSPLEEVAASEVVTAEIFGEDGTALQPCGAAGLPAASRDSATAPT